MESKAPLRSRHQILLDREFRPGLLLLMRLEPATRNSKGLGDPRIDNSQSGCLKWACITDHFKKRGRIQKIIVFGSHAKGGWVDEPFTMKGYRSDFVLQIIVNDRRPDHRRAAWSRVIESVRSAAAFHRIIDLCPDFSKLRSMA